MPKTGLAIPFQADSNGRLARVSGEDQLRKLILLNLSDLSSANPFQQDLGINSVEAIFAINNEALQAEMRRRINQLFRRLQLQERARLLKPPIFTVLSQTQELDVSISYVNLEENKPQDLSLRFSTASGTDPLTALLNAIQG